MSQHQHNNSEACVDCAPPSEQTTAPVSRVVPAPGAAPPVVGEAITPPPLSTPHVLIEYCDRCRWAPRASWTQTELLLTFPYPAIRTTSLQPLTTPETGGRFRVWLDRGNGFELVWDRKTEGGFPELKVLKQRVRNLIQPDMNLGHSDKK